MSLNTYENGTSQDSTVIVGTLSVVPEPGSPVLSTVSFDGGKFTSDGAGNLATGNLSPSSLFGKQSATAFVVASGGGAGGTIATTGIMSSRVAPAGAVTGAILQPGIAPGQMVTVINESAAASTITMAAAVTSNVAAGTTCVLAGLEAHLFVWDSVTALWYVVGPAAN